MTTILTKKKDTTGAPAPGDLTNAAGGAELAVNTYDKRLYTKDSGGNVVEVGTNPTILNIDNIQIDGNTISSTNSNGNINLTPNGTGSVVVSKLQVTGTFQLDGNVTVGDSSADTLTINSTITSNLIFTDNTYDIGASGATRPRNLYLAGNAVVGGNTTLGDASGDSVTINASTVSTPNGLNFDSNTFVIDATNNRVGVNGVASPVTPFQVYSVGANYTPSQGTGYGDLYVGNGTYGLAMGVATGGGGAGDIKIYGKGGTELIAFSTASTDANIFSISSSEVVVNQDARDVDFRVESDTITHMLFVDGGTNRVGIGTGSPATIVHSLQASGNTYYRSQNNLATVDVGVDSAGKAILYNNDNYPMGLGTNNTERVHIASNGNIGFLTTPKVWQSGISVLQLGGQAAWTYGGGTNMLLSNNRYFSGADKFIASGNYATFLEMSDGLFHFANSSAAGTADAAITWNYSLVTKTNGQVVLPGGSASIPTATSGYVLDVRGNVIATKASGNVSLVASASDANAAMNAYVGFGVEFNTDSSYTSYAWAKGGTRKMYLIANDSGSSSLGVAVGNPQAYTVNGSRCSIVTNQPILSLNTIASRIQSIGYNISDTSGSTLWVKFGTFYTNNNGWMCKLRYNGHVGFNANPAQLGMTDILFSTSNGGSYQVGSSGNFYGAFVAYRLGPANVCVTVRVVQVNTETFEIWGYIPNYSQGGYYEVSFSDGNAWIHSGATGTPSGNYVDVTPSVITYT